MNIAYISHSKIPSRFANSVHVMKMCQAFSKNKHNVILYAKEGTELVDDDYLYYGVDKVFKIFKISQLKNKFISLIHYIYQLY